MGLIEDEYYDDVTTGSEFTAPFSQGTLMYVELSIMTLTGAVALFGSVSNVINLCVFVRQGPLSHSPLVTLSAITIADGCACFLSVLVLVPIYIRYLVDYKGWTWDVEYFELYVTIRPTNTFTQITCLATAYLTFERVAGAVFPFKAKRFFTPKRSLVGMVCLFVFTFILYIPNNYTVIPSWEKKATNVTVPIPHWHTLMPKELSEAFFYANPVSLRFASIAVVVVCNCVLCRKIRQSNEFRKRACTTGRRNRHAQSPLPYSLSQLTTEGTGTALAVAMVLPSSQQSMNNIGSRSHLVDGDMKYSIVDERKAGERRRNTSTSITTITNATKSVNTTNTHSNNNDDGEKGNNISVLSITIEDTTEPVNITSTQNNLNNNHNNKSSNNNNSSNNGYNSNKSNSSNNDNKTNTTNNNSSIHTDSNSNNSTKNGYSSSSSYPAKDMALLRMIVVISSVFTVCYTVNVVAVITLMEDYHIYINYIAWDVVSLFQNINGSINVLFYYRMSSRFRQKLHQMCGRI